MKIKQVKPYVLPVAQWIISRYGCLTQEKFISDKNYLADILTQFVSNTQQH